MRLLEQFETLNYFFYEKILHEPKAQKPQKAQIATKQANKRK